MKQERLYLPLCFMMLAIVACSSVASGSEETPAQTEQTPSEPPATATELAPGGGFVTGVPLDVSTLPRLVSVPSGIESGPCYSEDTNPSIGLRESYLPYQTLCLNNFPIAPDSPGLTVTLIDPTGRSFSETFSYSQGEPVIVVNARGVQAGSVQDAPAPAVAIDLYLSANLTRGEWLAYARTEDSSVIVGPTLLPLEQTSSLDSILVDLDTSPFITPEYGQEGPIFTAGSTIHYVGTAYPPDTAITVAFYQEDLSAGTSETGLPYFTARYAASVTTDPSGGFQSQFIVDTTTPKGQYYAIAAPAITPDSRLNILTPRFSIE